MKFWVILYLNFIIYSFLGWIAQGIFVGFRKHRFENTGFLYGPYVPIYGFGALIVLYVLKPLSENVFFLFFGAMILTSILEYFTSWAMEKLFHHEWWNYSSRPFNLHGRICLLNSTLYGVATVFIDYISEPLIDRMITHFTLSGMEVFEFFFSVVFFTDLGFTLHHMLEQRTRLHQIHAAVHQVLASQQQALATQQEAVQARLAQRTRELQHLVDSYTMAHAGHRLARAFPDTRVQARYQESLDKARALIDDKNQEFHQKAMDLKKKLES